MRHFQRKWTVPVLWAGIALFVLLQLVVVARTRMVYWDEAVFLTMGKFLASGGQLGFWEHIRPPGLPLLTGLLYHSGAAVPLTKVLLVLLAALAGYLVYSLLAQQVRPLLAALAALLLLFSQVWFAYANLVLTDVLSACVMVVAVWLYSRERLFLAGLLASMAFLIRFPAGLLLLGLLVTECMLLYRDRTRLRGTVLLLAGFLLPVLLWLGANTLAWSGEVPPLQAAFRPLIDGFSTAAAENVGLYEDQPGYYVLYLLRKLPVLLLALVGLLLLPRLPRGTPLALAALFGVLFFEWLRNDQLRFLALLLPGLVLLAAWGAHLIAERFSLRTAVAALFVLSIGFSLIDDAGLVVQQRADPPQLAAYYSYLEERPVEGFIVVTDPVSAWHAPNKAVPMYFGLFSYAEAYFPSAAAVAAQPRNTRCGGGCAEEVEENWALLREQYALVHETEVGDDSYFIFVRKSLG